MVAKHARVAVLEGPHPVDVAVGLAIRLRRKAMGLSQEALALSLHITFQQVQKYEKGTNRISASKLFEAAKFLKAPIELFFRGVGDVGIGDGRHISDTEQSVQQFLMTTEGLALAQAFPKIGKPAVRRRILDLARALADE